MEPSATVIAAPDSAGLGSTTVGNRRRRLLGRAFRWMFWEGRLVIFLGWVFLAISISTFTLCRVPVYSVLLPVWDHGGALSIPFAERPSIDGRLHTWPLREYFVAPTKAFEARLVIGDYLLVMHDEPNGGHIALRASVFPSIPSALIRYIGDTAESVEPLASPILAPGVPHTVSGIADTDTVTFLIDGRSVASSRSRGAGAWHLAAGIKDTVILEVGTGPSSSTLVRRDPWSIKKKLLVFQVALLTATFPFLIGRARTVSRWVYALAIALLIEPFVSRSPYLLYSLLAFVFVVLATVGGLWTMTLQRWLLSRSPGRPAIRALAVTVLFGTWAYCAVLLLDPIDRPRIEPSLPDGFRQHHGAEAAVKRVVVFGDSTVMGAGLAQPQQEGFVTLLSPTKLGGWVEMRARKGGVKMKDILEMEEQAELSSGDIAVLYMTFGEAMTPSTNVGMHLIADDVWGPLIGRKEFIGEINALYDSATWTSEKFAAGKGRQYAAEVSTFVARAQQVGARVILVGEVCADQIIYANSQHGMAKFQDVLAQVAQQHDAEYVDFRQDLLERRDDFLFVDFVHLNRRGHALLAERLNMVIASPTHAGAEQEVLRE